MPAFKALGKKAETLTVMPDAFDEPTAPAAKQINRAAKRILTKGLLHQRRQAIHAATHIRMAAGKENPRPSRKANHRPASAARTRPKATPSTAASTLINAPPGSVISIIPDWGIGDGVDGFGFGADNRTSAKSAVASPGVTLTGAGRSSIALRHV
jgi:hypothetical protein